MTAVELHCVEPCRISCVKLLCFNTQRYEKERFNYLFNINSNNYFYNIPEFIMKNQQDYIEMLKEEIKKLKEEIERIKD